MTTTWQAVNVLTGTTEGPKYNDTGVTSEIWIANLGSTVGANDIINGPTLPAGTYIVGAAVDTDKLDSAGSPAITFEVGYINAGTTAAGAFIATGNTTAQAGGIQGANVAGTIGFTSTLNSTMQAKITNAPGTSVAGKFRMRLDYTASP